MSRNDINPDGIAVTMFSGKGGVGKTTCAAATALHYASLGSETLAISTDATPSLSHIFELRAGEKPTRVQDSLYISEPGEREVEDMWNRRFGRDVYDVFSSFVSVGYDEFVEFTTSMLPGLRDEFMVDHIKELSRNGSYNTVVWDTAPLGQTLALLQTPAMLVEHLRMAPRIYAKLRLSNVSKEPILDVITRWQKLSAEDMDFLRNRVRFVIVTIPEALAVEQLEGVFRELDRHGLKVGQLVVNNVIKADGSDFLALKASQQRGYLDRMHETYSHLDIVEIPMFPYELKGLDRLREVERVLFPAC
jgi:arsenite-transporting ATPase